MIEYLVLPNNNWAYVEGAQRELNKLAADGWRFVASTARFFIFIREVEVEGIRTVVEDLT